MASIESSAPSRSLLRTALLSNAGFSTLTGLSLLFASSALAGQLLKVSTIWPGISTATAFLELGIGLLIFAAALLWIALRPERRYVVTVVAADVLWVAGSALLLFLAPGAFTTTGVVAVAAVAVVVGLLAITQWRGLKRSGL